MKMTRKLIPAIAMLLVSAVMMSTASFAWFTMNSTVQATGMTVTAVAPASLWIAQPATGEGTPAWASAMGLTNENTVPQTGYAPAIIDSSTTFDAWTFKELTSAASQRVDVNGTLAGAQDSDYTTSNSFFKDKFLLKLDGQTGHTAPVSVKVAISHGDAIATADEIWKAIKVAVVVSGTTLNFEFATLNQTGAQGEVTYTAAQQLVTLTAGAADATEVVVYAYIDGADTDCKNSNALNTDAFVIDLSFTIGEVTAPGNSD